MTSIQTATTHIDNARQKSLVANGYINPKELDHLINNHLDTIESVFDDILEPSEYDEDVPTVFYSALPMLILEYRELSGGKYPEEIMELLKEPGYEVLLRSTNAILESNPCSVA
ncbi:hypothetical protein KDX31_05775 [Amphritea atlantica]|uniref:Phage gp6-like head-tail connector protein n=1 Tax=Amphritea atlantica TaxID=355243 RepID=A0ABY5GXL0_9GAMM|nr:hypothetical protein KDX31_05775 [Amphritea atlantica]